MGAGAGHGMGGFHLYPLFSRSIMTATVVNAPLRLTCKERSVGPRVASNSVISTDLPGQGEECATGGGSQGETIQQAAAKVSV